MVVGFESSFPHVVLNALEKDWVGQHRANAERRDLQNMQQKKTPKKSHLFLNSVSPQQKPRNPL